MEDLQESSFRRKLWEDPGAYAVLFTTPLCGTCQVAKRMLEVAEAALPQLPVYEINLNTAPALAQDYKISSVPCLLLVKKRRLWRKAYAFQSAVHLYELLNSLQSINEEE